MDNDMVIGGDRDGLVLRWSRLTKRVQLEDSGAGLVRGTIGGRRRKSLTTTTIRRAKEELKESDILEEKSTGTTKTILNQVSGCAQPGEVLCMLGPSGSGKTTLLNCLSGRTSYDSGIITVNGQSLSSTHRRKKLMAQIAYVRQEDIFFSHLSVRDQFSYTAMLRLPQTWSREQKMDHVNQILKLLRLIKVADSPISRLSGGEKKRVNIGTELLTDPSCVLLDEPTSGLDSTSAVALISLLQGLAKTRNKTVITSIHQPSSALFRSFDKLIIVAEGNVVYFGRPTDSLKYLRNLELQCPDGYNAADHWMDLLVKDSTVVHALDDGTVENSARKLASTDTCSSDSRERTTRTDPEDVTPTILDDNGVENSLEPTDQPLSLRGMQPLARLKQAWDGEAVALQMDLATSQVEGNQHFQVGDSGTKYNTTWLFQYRVLVHRCLKNSRSAIFTTINLIKSAALGLVAGALWFQIEYTEERVFDLSSFFFFSMTYWVFDSMFNALMSFPVERRVILKERSSGSYHLGAYFLAKTTSEMPTRLVLPSIYMVIAFWMAGMSHRVEIFLGSTLISLLSVIAGEALGLLVGACIQDMETAMTTMTVGSLVLMLLGGFFVENVPSWLLWGRYLSPFKYSFDASRQLIFDRDVPCDGSGALEDLCGGGQTEGSVSPEDVIAFLEIQGSVAFNVVLLIVIGLIPRFFAYLALRATKETDR